MKRNSPAVLLAVATALVILADAVIVVAPQVLADPQPSPTTQATIEPAIAAASPTQQPTLKFDEGVPTYSLPTPPPGPLPTILLPPTPKPTPTPTPAPYRDTVTNAKAYAKSRLGAAQYNCFNAVIMKESKWNPYAGTPSGPYGIPQAYPGSKMASFGSNWRTSPLTQVKWGIWYVNKQYGSACGAWSFWQSHGWY
ncbi:MAG TPA: transglycosylase SLT domain-containing protein [Candidatus Limnocylindrales bacterium]